MSQAQASKKSFYRGVIDGVRSVEVKLGEDESVPTLWVNGRSVATLDHSGTECARMLGHVFAKKPNELRSVLIWAVFTDNGASYVNELVLIENTSNLDEITKGIEHAILSGADDYEGLITGVTGVRVEYHSKGQPTLWINGWNMGRLSANVNPLVNYLEMTSRMVDVQIHVSFTKRGAWTKWVEQSVDELILKK